MLVYIQFATCTLLYQGLWVGVRARRGVLGLADALSVLGVKLDKAGEWGL